MNTLTYRSLAFSLSLVFAFLGSTSHATQAKGINLGIVLPAPATRIHKHWQPFADYLSGQLGEQVNIVVPRDMASVKGKLLDGSIDLLYVNSYLFHLLQEEQLLTPMVQMQNIDGEVYSKGRILVRNDSPIQHTEGLKGKNIALISPLGAGAYLAPRAHLRDHQIKIETDTSVTFTKNLKKSAYMVLHGDADAAVMCAVNYKLLSTKIETGELRVLDSTEKFPEALIAHRKNMAPERANKILKVLSQLDNDLAKQALAPMSDLKIKTFIPYDAGIEEDTKAMRQKGQL